MCFFMQWDIEGYELKDVRFKLGDLENDCGGLWASPASYFRCWKPQEFLQPTIQHVQHWQKQYCGQEYLQWSHWQKHLNHFVPKWSSGFAGAIENRGMGWHRDTPELLCGYCWWCIEGIYMYMQKTLTLTLTLISWKCCYICIE